MESRWQALSPSQLPSTGRTIASTIDNIKVLLDACTGILWADDGQIIELHLRKAYDRSTPRVELVVSGIDDRARDASTRHQHSD
jgi:Holliday junction resolvase RusA-like endonuclease